MIFVPHNFIFLHVPRTGGYSVMNAAAANFGKLFDVSIIASGLKSSYRGWHVHSPARQLRVDIPQWDRIWRWAITRNPWESTASRYRRCLRDMDKVLCHPCPETPSARLHWQFLAETREKPFEQWVEWHLPLALETSKGFWHQQCCGELGEDLGVEAVPFTELRDLWPGLAERMGLAGVELPHVNAAPGRVEWTRRAIDAVGDLCIDDVVRFGYRPPEGP